ncbi:hypothetical protein [Legionella micdadei]|uniref:Uncharacterized protein n=1 Tax=Legionella micdadei TaxID=451 RepID=A0A098GHK5_LEGMI|nr:hypothetical protein [Legionella micdadei]ARG96676.1 hypothetical protein B6N58_02740 [Legionella micdadei]ARG99422.1 hypothetical protein B6V88_02730 [Legionella micdadei]KTD26338.1 hypothetical protein Lmic_2432 [Legionella micdadei]NSL19086.1 hypothetical protein [Legionella micdadei]CEG61949.1 conserved protein of unknown function [Legionella micdadei]
MTLEKHFAYKITNDSKNVTCRTHSEYEEERMADLLKEIKAANSEGIYWIFKQREGEPQEPLCIIDCQYKRIYYHYSGDVEDIDTMIQKLSK